MDTGHYFDVKVITDLGEEIVLNVYALSPVDAEFIATQMTEDGLAGTLSNIVVSACAYMWAED